MSQAKPRREEGVAQLLLLPPLSGRRRAHCAKVTIEEDGEGEGDRVTLQIIQLTTRVGKH